MSRDELSIKMTDNEDRSQSPGPRFSVPVMPLYISPLNCEPTVGMNPREFREFIRSEGLTIIERGKNRLVRASELVARLEAKAKGPAKIESNADRLRRMAGLRGAK